MNAQALVDLFGLDGKVALVTGASNGIGRTLAEGLASAGATVALAARSADRLVNVQQSIHAAGGQAEVFPIDLALQESAHELGQAVAERCGQVDILVNCAGMNRRQPAAEVTPENYEAIMAVNLRSAFFLSQAIYPLMQAQGGGKIISIGSLTVSLALAHVSIYGMTKSALAQMTRTLAVEWAKDNIQVNCLCPGFIETDLTRALWENPDRNRWIMERIPADRPGRPRDLVGMGIFLASSASDYVTGQAIYVDGGFTAGSHW